ncbi:hypothetical protein PHLCEN_2v2572 [Hermanssonia centrifuga]|uniref:Uncharacterized protein n=1 Tax=Hermanssonia centrifuga TaxID=98765 RepID=A0A2R6RLK2_9APHY|nr:hypothetical protein PHLCEN_2v2572 [Hermanssonia centrifuga]
MHEDVPEWPDPSQRMRAVCDHAASRRKPTIEMLLARDELVTKHQAILCPQCGIRVNLHIGRKPGLGGAWILNCYSADCPWFRVPWQMPPCMAHIEEIRNARKLDMADFIESLAYKRRTASLALESQTPTRKGKKVVPSTPGNHSTYSDGPLTPLPDHMLSPVKVESGQVRGPFVTPQRTSTEALLFGQQIPNASPLKPTASGSRQHISTPRKRKREEDLIIPDDVRKPR